MEAELMSVWQSICERRGIILLGPKAAKPQGWTVDEAEFVSDLVKQFAHTYSIDSDRVVLHGYSSGAQFAFHLAFKYRDLFHGLLIANGTPPQALSVRPNEPGNSTQFYVLAGQS